MICTNRWLEKERERESVCFDHWRWEWVRNIVLLVRWPKDWIDRNADVLDPRRHSVSRHNHNCRSVRTSTSSRSVPDLRRERHNQSFVSSSPLNFTYPMSDSSLPPIWKAKSDECSLKRRHSLNAVDPQMQRIEVRRIDTESTRITSNELTLGVSEEKDDRNDHREKRRRRIYPIISRPWFFESFFALFSINETIWWHGETWSIDRELSVPRSTMKTSIEHLPFSLTGGTRLSDELLNISSRDLPNRFHVDQIRRSGRTGQTAKFDRLSVNDDVRQFFGHEYCGDFRHDRCCRLVRLQQMMSIDRTAALQSLSGFRIDNAVPTSIGSSARKEEQLDWIFDTKRFLQIIIGFGIRSSTTGDGWILLQLIDRRIRDGVRPLWPSSSEWFVVVLID